ncbi:MAG: endonuclease MutS2 [Oscillospiraceae bacterium]|nr:endonuclease MutS2 [Oscillospiraceae bacterium]
MTLYEKSLRVLELPNILEMLATEAVSDAAKEKALALHPFAEIDMTKTLLAETSAAKHMMTLKSAPPFSGVKDIKGACRRANMGGMLNTRELLDIAALLRAAQASISYASGSRGEDKSAIDYLFSSLNSNKFLENKISTAIVSEDDIADNASRELADIRRHMRLSGEKIRQSLNKIITSPTYSKALQEPIITMKNGRYVVPVKSDQKNAIPGLVHDISSSGATQFIEPMVVVEINNALRELQAKEKQEIERILMELSADVAAHSEDIISDFELLIELDFIFAKAKLSYKLDAVEPEVCDKRYVKLHKARHPLLPKHIVVPIDVWLGGEFDTLVITGPNTGGKTVTMKTLGLLCAMAQCGLHIPAKDGSIVPVFKNILADIGDEQSIEQSLSTFSSHMTNIVGILDVCEADSLLLFDELGAGTDPIEGAALAISIIEYARKCGSLIGATTHYAELKTFAVNSPGVVNASCEFDVETLRPTYRLIIGIPGKSNAFAISKRLGLSDQIIEDAKNRVNSENAAFEDALASLESTRVRMEAERDEAKKLLRDAQEDRKQAQDYKSKLDAQREKAAEIAKREAAKILESARTQAEQVMDELATIKRKAAQNADMQRLNDEKSDIFRRLNEAEQALGAVDLVDDYAPPSRALKAGDRVKLRDIGTLADVISIGADGTLSLQAGIIKVFAHPNDVVLVSDEQKAEVKRHSSKSEAKLRAPAFKPELDIRGMQSDEAIAILERFIDSARMSGLTSVTVIHGKGTGALRQAVNQSLRREKGIESFRLGRYGEGEDGVTIVELV